jgi:hypothetical protein
LAATRRSQSGFISDFLSKSVVTGFVFGLAITIVLLLLKRRGHDSLVKYPEELVLVG